MGQILGKYNFLFRFFIEWTRSIHFPLMKYLYSSLSNIQKHHFKADNILVSLGITRKTLKPDVMIFNFKNTNKIKPRKSPRKRCLPATNETTDNDSYPEKYFEINNANDLFPVTQSSTNFDRTKLLEKEMDNLKKGLREAENNE